MGLDLLLMVINAALGALSGSGKIPPIVINLVSALGPIITKAITAIQGGQGAVADVVTALGSLSGILAVLKAETGLDPAVINQINVYDQAVQAGIAAYLDSKSGVDLTKLSPLSPIA